MVACDGGRCFYAGVFFAGVAMQGHRAVSLARVLPRFWAPEGNFRLSWPVFESRYYCHVECQEHTPFAY